MVLALNFKRIECHCCCCMATELCSKTTAFVSFRVSSQNCDLPYENAITLRCQLCGGLTADLPPSISFDGIDHPKLSTTQDRCKICLKNGWYMRGKCGVHLHCNTGAVYFDMHHTNIWLFFFFLRGFVKMDIFWSIVDLEIKTNTLDSYPIFILRTQKCISLSAMFPHGNKSCHIL